jgi:asparagine synthase (glutamine-hydrolysing)
MQSILLRDTDQMSMAHALEVRVPLIDHRLVEFMFSLNGDCKVDPRQPKPLLTLPLKNALPRECVHRRKRCFELPFAVWLQQGMSARVRDRILDTGGDRCPLFDGAGLARVWRQFEERRVSWSRIWGIFILRNWLNSSPSKGK